MTAPLLDLLITRHGCAFVDKAGLADLLAGGGETVLFFTGDPQKCPETNDLEVVFPELHEAFAKRFRLAMVDRRDEAELMAELGVLVTPTLAFFRGGELLGLLPRLRDWAVYMDEIPAILGISERAA